MWWMLSWKITMSLARNLSHQKCQMGTDSTWPQSGPWRAYGVGQLADMEQFSWGCSWLAEGGEKCGKGTFGASAVVSRSEKTARLPTWHFSWNGLDSTRWCRDAPACDTGGNLWVLWQDLSITSGTCHTSTKETPSTHCSAKSSHWWSMSSMWQNVSHKSSTAWPPAQRAIEVLGFSFEMLQANERGADQWAWLWGQAEGNGFPSERLSQGTPRQILEMGSRIWDVFFSSKPTALRVMCLNSRVMRSWLVGHSLVCCHQVGVVVKRQLGKSKIGDCPTFAEIPLWWKRRSKRGSSIGPRTMTGFHGH